MQTSAVGDDNLLFDVIMRWVGHKREKRQGYKPIGLKTVCSQMIKRRDEMGIESLDEMVQVAMSNNWQGWNFPDRYRKLQDSREVGTAVGSKVDESKGI